MEQTTWQEHIATSIDRAALSTHGRERLAVLGLLLREEAVASWGEAEEVSAERR